MTYDDLIELLEPVGLPIVAPGEQTKALPCLAINPVGMGTADGFAFLYEECELRVLYPMNQNNSTQFFELHDATVEVWKAMFGTKVQVDDDGPLFGEDTEPPALYFQLGIRFPGNVLCEPAPPGIRPSAPLNAIATVPTGPI